MLEVSANKIEQTTEQTLVGQCLFDGAISIKRNYKCGKSNGKECGGEQIRKTGRLLRSLQEATGLPNTFTTHSRAQAWSQPASQPAGELRPACGTEGSRADGPGSLWQGIAGFHSQGCWWLALALEAFGPSKLPLSILGRFWDIPLGALNHIQGVKIRVIHA